MGIFSRLTDIVNSNINSILDRAEDPDKIIRMVIQEMEDTLVEVRSSAAKAIADQKDIERKIKRLDSAKADWDKKAELAISKGRDDLAKGALVEKAKLAEFCEHLDDEVKLIKEALGRHEDDVIKLDSKLREAKAKKASLKARVKTATNNVRVKRNLYDGRISAAFERFEKVEQRLDRIEAESESYELGGNSETLEAQIDALESDDAVDKELAALKSKLSGTNKPAGKKTAAKK
jgi:phage shock protein A